MNDTPGVQESKKNTCVPGVFLCSVYDRMLKRCKDDVLNLSLLYDNV